MTMTNIAVHPLAYNGQIISERDDMVSLTDMWKAAGADESKRPAEWLRQPATKDFVECVSAANMGDTHIKSRRGANGGTFGHWQIGLAYAKYLSPEFHMACNIVIRERMEGRVSPTHAVLDEESKRAIGGIVKSCTGVMIREALEGLLPKLIDERLAADPRAVATTYKPALEVLVDKGVPSRRRRAFSQKVSSRLRRYSTRHALPMRISRETGRYLFHVDAIGGWMQEEGQGLISSHVAALAGQGVLEFKRGR